MRFRRSIKLFPGVKLNVSKSGISASMGIRGVSVTMGSKGQYLNYGIPGTGIYDRVRLDSPRAKEKSPSNLYVKDRFILNYQEIEIKSKDIGNLTSATLAELQDMLKECYKERGELKTEIQSLKVSIFFSSVLNILSKLLVVGFFIKWFGDNVKDKKGYLIELCKQLEECVVDIDISLEGELKQKYSDLCDSFGNVCNSHSIWSISSYHHIDRVRERASYGTVINKRAAKFSTNIGLDFIKTAFEPLAISNAYVSMYIYPSFVLILDKDKNFGLIEFKDILLLFSADHFVEDGQVPDDSKILYYAWHRSNKDGSPDLRFKDNYQIPVCQYGRIDLQSSKGLNESFQISSHEKAKKFADSFSYYIRQFSN